MQHFGKKETLKITREDRFPIFQVAVLPLNTIPLKRQMN